MVAVVHVSNALGTINPVRQMIRSAHARGIPVLVDGAQAVAHMPVDVQPLDCDFYAFSGHKIFGPTGIGVLYGKAALLDRMPPWQGGGDMISSVTFEGRLQRGPKFRWGRISPARSAGGGARYVEGVGLDRITGTNTNCRYGKCAGVDFGAALTRRHEASVLAFVLDSVRPHDIGPSSIEGVRFAPAILPPSRQIASVPATARASLASAKTRSTRWSRIQGAEVFDGHLDDLYQRSSDHNKRPRNFHAIVMAEDQGTNPPAIVSDREDCGTAGFRTRASRVQAARSPARRHRSADIKGKTVAEAESSSIFHR